MKRSTKEKLQFAAIVAGVGLLVTGLVYWLIQTSVNAGRIIDKQHYPAYTTQETRYHEIGEVRIPYTVDVHHPERWMLTLEGRSPDGKVRTKNKSVPAFVYRRFQFGDYIQKVDGDWVRLQAESVEQQTE